jgi:hypothetical protein
LFIATKKGQTHSQYPDKGQKALSCLLKKIHRKRIFKTIRYKQTNVPTIGSNLQCGERLKTQLKSVTAHG